MQEDPVSFMLHVALPSGLSDPRVCPLAILRVYPWPLLVTLCEDRHN